MSAQAPILDPGLRAIGLRLRVALAIGAVFWGMLAYESLKELAAPSLTKWQSHWLTIGFATALASAGAGLILRRREARNRRLTEEQWESQRVARHYQELFENMLEGCAHCEVLLGDGEASDFVYLDVNKNFEKLTGLRNVVGKRVTEVIPGIRESNPELLERYRRVALSGVPERFETFVGPLGIWFSISVFSPRPGEFVALFDNVTERKQAGERIAKSAAYFRSLIEHAADITAVVGPDSAIRYISPSVERLLGFSPLDLEGKDALGFLHPEDRALTFERIGRALETGTRLEPVEVRLRHRDGSWRSVSIVGSALPEETAMEGLIINARDLTERQQLEAQLRQSQKMEAVGQLAGGVAHDFNNLLTAILGYSQMIEARLDTGDPMRESVEEIRKAGERAAGLTRQLLAFSRRQILEPRVLDLNTVVADFRKMLKRLIGEDIELRVIQDPKAGWVRVDPAQIEQVILNLAVNARDAMPGGGWLTIETSNAELDGDFARRHAGSRPGSYVALAFSDDGAGMSAETRAHVFEPFFTTKAGGTGLGLATVYGIVKQSGGYITVWSEPGKGTTFRIYLPRVEAPADSARRPSAGRPLRGSETVLLVEDQTQVRELVRKTLESCGYSVLEGDNGRKALEIATGHKGPIHLLVSDVVMPGESGPELASRVKEIRPEVRVLFMSGHTDHALLRRNLTEHGGGFLRKPFTRDLLAQRVRDALDAEENGAA